MHGHKEGRGGLRKKIFLRFPYHKNNLKKLAIKLQLYGICGSKFKGIVYSLLVSDSDWECSTLNLYTQRHLVLNIGLDRGGYMVFQQGGGADWLARGEHRNKIRDTLHSTLFTRVKSYIDFCQQFSISKGWILLAQILIRVLFMVGSKIGFFPADFRSWSGFSESATRYP